MKRALFLAISQHSSRRNALDRATAPAYASLVIVALLLTACTHEGPTSAQLSPTEEDAMSMADETAFKSLIRGGIQYDTEGAGASPLASIHAAKAAGFESIDVPGAFVTLVFGINTAGQIVGRYIDASGEYGFLWDNGHVTKIEFPGAAWTEASGINPQGDIVGLYGIAGEGRIRGFLLKEGVYTDISVPGHLHTMPTRISASGEIVGCFHGTQFLSDMRGFVRRGEEVTPFEMLPSTMHNGITPGGKLIAGLSYESLSVVRAYVIDRGEYRQFDAPVNLQEDPDAPFTAAWDVNPSGTVVGIFNRISPRGFVRDASGFRAIDVPDARWTRAFGINPQGDIVGVYADANGNVRGFLLRGRARS